jgi:hypothetical protein
MKFWKEEPPLYLTGCLFVVLFLFFTAVFNRWAEIKVAIWRLLH